MASELGPPWFPTIPSLMISSPVLTAILSPVIPSPDSSVVMSHPLEPRHEMAVTPESSAVTPESSAVMATMLESRHDMVAKPESSAVMVATPEPHRIMTTMIEPLHDIHESSAVMAMAILCV